MKRVSAAKDATGRGPHLQHSDRGSGESGCRASAKPVGQDGGYLWRLNACWRFLERDGGTRAVRVITLTRDIPVGSAG